MRCPACPALSGRGPHPPARRRSRRWLDMRVTLHRRRTPPTRHQPTPSWRIPRLPAGRSGSALGCTGRWRSTSSLEEDVLTLPTGPRPALRRPLSSVAPSVRLAGRTRREGQRRRKAAVPASQLIQPRRMRGSPLRVLAWAVRRKTQPEERVAGADRRLTVLMDGFSIDAPRQFGVHVGQLP